MILLLRMVTTSAPMNSIRNNVPAIIPILKGTIGLIAFMSLSIYIKYVKTSLFQSQSTNPKDFSIVLTALY